MCPERKLLAIMLAQRLHADVEDIGNLRLDDAEADQRLNQEPAVVSRMVGPLLTAVRFWRPSGDRNALHDAGPGRCPIGLYLGRSAGHGGNMSPVLVIYRRQYAPCIVLSCKSQYSTFLPVGVWRRITSTILAHPRHGVWSAHRPKMGVELVRSCVTPDVTGWVGVFDPPSCRTDVTVQRGFG